jgi:hypothetical protein
MCVRSPPVRLQQFNNRILEVSSSGSIEWSFGSNNPTLCNPGPGAVIAPNSAERLTGGYTLISGTGSASCPDNRVIAVDNNGIIVWQYGSAGSGSVINTPVFAIMSSASTIFITDQGNNRVIEVALNGTIVWSYGDSTKLNSPNSAIPLANGDVLIADENNNRVLQVIRAGTVVAEWSTGLQTAAFAARLANGDTLIVDNGNNRVVEEGESDGSIAWSVATNTDPGSAAASGPTGAQIVASGQALICDSGNNRVILVNRTQLVAGAPLTIVWQYGTTATPGNGVNQLNAPYSAFMVGDYTSLVQPPSSIVFPAYTPGSTGSAVSSSTGSGPAPEESTTIIATVVAKTAGNPNFGRGNPNAFKLSTASADGAAITLTAGVTYTFVADHIPSQHLFYLTNSSTHQSAQESNSSLVQGPSAALPRLYSHPPSMRARTIAPSTMAVSFMHTWVALSSSLPGSTAVLMACSLRCPSPPCWHSSPPRSLGYVCCNNANRCSLGIHRKPFRRHLSVFSSSIPL